MEFSRASLVAHSKNSARVAGDRGLTLVGKIPWRKIWQPTPVSLPKESHGQRSLAGFSPQGCKESDTTEQLTLLLFMEMESKRQEYWSG